MSIHRGRRWDDWGLLVGIEREPVSDDAIGLARWEGEGGYGDPCPAPSPVNDVVRDLVRACLIPRLSHGGSACERRTGGRPGRQA